MKLQIRGERIKCPLLYEMIHSRTQGLQKLPRLVVLLQQSGSLYEPLNKHTISMGLRSISEG